MKVSQVPRPFICGVLVEANPAATIADMTLGKCAGAQVFELNLARLEPRYRTPGALAEVFRRTSLPVFTTYRRYGLMATDTDRLAEDADDERMQLQLDLIDVGSKGFDMEMDTFGRVAGPPFQTLEGMRYSIDPDSPPREVSEDPAVAMKQRQLIEQAHRRGGEVLASCHVLTRIRSEGVIRICEMAEDRGADLLKVVRFNHSWEDVVETLATTVALRHKARIPYVMMAMGEYGKVTRLLSPMLGSMLCYCKRTYAPGSFMDQPLISQAKAVLENVDFCITPRAEEFTVEWFQRLTDGG